MVSNYHFNKQCEVVMITAKYLSLLLAEGFVVSSIGGLRRHLSYNHLTGTVPTELGAMTAMRSLYVPPTCSNNNQ
jgi:hypothetical protein